MRKTDRIEPFLDKFGQVWKENFPDMRFGQLINNLQRFAGNDLFYLEEDKFIELLEKFVDTYTK